MCGPRGSRIQDIRARSQARIDIDNHCAPGTDYQVVRISGSEDAIQRAVAMVNEAINRPQAPPLALSPRPQPAPSPSP